MVTARIDLQGLNKELNSFKGAFDSWAQQSVASAEARKESHYKNLREFQSTIKNLYQQQNDLERRALEVQQRLQNENEEVVALESELSKIQEEQNKLPGLVAEVLEALQAETRAANRQAKQLETKEETREKTLSGVTHALRMYEERLGMSFHNSDDCDELSMVFTHVDQKDPAREFRMAIRVLENDHYEVRSCLPHLDNMQDLVDGLNASNDFSAFVKDARAAFVALAQGGA